jgi:hypothetical protein
VAIPVTILVWELLSSSFGWFQRLAPADRTLHEHLARGQAHSAIFVLKNQQVIDPNQYFFLSRSLKPIRGARRFTDRSK